ncbi:MAG: hypothetical protein ACLVGV_07895 [Methanobrevibacter smithii]
MMISETVSFSSGNVKYSNFAVANSLVINTASISSMGDEDLEFYRSTQEALDRYDDSKKGMSAEEFLKELDSW